MQLGYSDQTEARQWTGGREAQPGGTGLPLHTTDVGRRAPAEEDAGSEASELGAGAESAEREREEERRGGRRGAECRG